MARIDDIAEEVLSWAEEPDETLLDNLARNLADAEPMGFMGASFADSSSSVSNAEKWLEENTLKITEEYDNKEGFDDVKLAVNLADVLSSTFPAMPLGPLSLLVARRIINRRSALYETPKIEGVPEEEADPVSEEKSKITPVFSAHATPQVIAERLRAAREAKGWTQQDLANAMGLKSRRTVQNLESARDGVTVAAVRSAMEALEIQEL